MHVNTLEILFNTLTTTGLILHIIAFFTSIWVMSKKDMKGAGCFLRVTNFFNLFRQKDVRQFWLVLYSTLVSLGSLYLNLKLATVTDFALCPANCLVKAFIMVLLGMCFILWTVHEAWETDNNV